MDVYGLYFTLLYHFGTNLLTGGQARIAVFCLFQCFEEKEYQTESKRHETFGTDLFGTNANRETWCGRQATSEAATRVPGAPPRDGHAPHPCGPLDRQPTYFFLLYIHPYPETISGDHENLIPPPQPSISARSHLGAFTGAPSEGESTTEGLYIIPEASPMNCE